MDIVRQLISTVSVTYALFEYDVDEGSSKQFLICGVYLYVVCRSYYNYRLLPQTPPDRLKTLFKTGNEMHVPVLPQT